jgi:predicted nucleotide-binding protein
MIPNAKDVFVVHGRDMAARDALFDFMRSLGLNPMEFEEARKRTGKPSPYMGEILDCAFQQARAIVVLMTGDDEARLRDAFRREDEPLHEVSLSPQPRANVIFEAGMALGRDPKHTVLVQIGDLRPFSDIAGLHVVRLRTGGPAERQSIADRLRDAECDVTTAGRSDWLERDYFSRALELTGRPR